ncbi:helix-turn-helix transcriptional regulator [Ligilactobacillus murinus]|uniref:helix-turn-helix domain-containing protein n=1 Tax=Ligilactobacillus murinus TaxID=1622 RepID=UPI00296AD86E|nr:helix-turn-helix transcriptional regulator [Ligilactobacillus murinus]WOY89415.1 helix-turn-helix transcriptional regulator [Ligilactobacillus murinus]
MTTWNNFKKSIDSVSKEELTLIESLAYLQATRLEQGITQQELAKKIGMTQPQLAKIENLDSLPTLMTLNRYAKGLGLEAVLSFRPIVTN